MAQDGQSLEMQDKPDGCLSAIDEEREPCLKKTEVAETNNAADSNNKNNGTVPAAAADAAGTTADAVPQDDGNNTAAAANNNVKNSKKVKFRALSAATNLEQKLRDQTGYSRTGLFVAAAIALLCLILFTILVVLLFKWPRPARPIHVCRTASCLQASAEVLPKLNPDASPCYNFRDYACGEWLKTNELPSHMSSWSLKKRLRQNQKVKIRNMVVTLRNVASSTLLNWKMKHFFESCMNLDNIEGDEGKPLKKIISVLGGWHVLKDFALLEWDMTRTLVQLHSKYSVSPFFKIDVVPDDRAAGQFIIQISPSGLGLPDRRYYYRKQEAEVVKAYKQYLIDVSQMLGATSSDAGTFSEQMFSYEKRIAEITPASNNEDPFTSHQRLKLSKLKDIAGMIPLLDILQSKFPDSNINDDTFISVVSPNYFSNLSSLISSTDRTGLNNYYIWKLAETYVPYLSVKFREIVKIYNADLNGEKDLPPRWETCVSLLQRFMGVGVAASIEQGIDNKYAIVNEVVEIFNHTRETIRSHVANNNDLEPALRHHVLGKLDSLTVQVGLPDYRLKDNNVSQLYSPLLIQKMDFFLNVHYAVTFLNEFAQTKLKSKKEEFGWIDDLVSEDPKVTYNVASNKVIVPMSLLSAPYFEPGYPEALLYGGLGVEISSAILSSIYPPGVAYGTDGILLQRHSAAVNRSICATAEAHQCFGRFDDKDGVQVELANNTALSAMLSVSSVRFALETLSKKAQLEQLYRQPAMESYEYDQMFYITYAQSLCAIKSPQQQDLDSMYNLMSNESLLLKTVTEHLDSFKNAFSCDGLPTQMCNSLY